MYFMYVDESGDVGLGPGSSDYFILSGLVIHECYWHETLSSMASMRRDLFKKYGFSTDEELHAEHLIGRTNNGRSGMRRDAVLLMMRDVLKYEAGFKYARMINVVIDKRDKRKGYDVFLNAWDTILNRFENTIKYQNFPSPWETRPQNERGFVIVDETDEEKLRRLVRSMRVMNDIPSRLYPGTTVSNNLKAIVEDPMHKKSDLSLPIQLCDVNAYFLLQTIAPNSTVKRHKAKNYFYYLRPILCKQASSHDPDGIVHR
ncbi:MAG: DUF3800 domain-containing protein [Atopobiaceae bacterium]|nr:DUF3800 domain-containing protein [Atopobiaceae bacterium]